jgi:hyperosmotically inducible protein
MNSNISNKIALGFVILLTASVSYAADNSNISESRMEATIETRYAVNDMLSAYNLEAEVNGSTATLNGKVSNSVEKELAGNLAKDVRGVDSVTNNIIVDDNIIVEQTESFAQKVSDASTTARVKSRFLWSSGVPAMAINVDTLNDVVALKGAVDSETEKKLAEKLAESTKGVRRVDNKIVVKSQTNNTSKTENTRAKLGSIDFDKVSNNAGQALEGAGETLSDSWINTKVSASLRLTRDLYIDDLSVKTNNGVVVITGRAYSNADKELATEIAKDVKGVKSVVNQITVI